MEALIRHSSITEVTWFSIVEGVDTPEAALEAYEVGESNPIDYEIGETREWFPAVVVKMYEEEDDDSE